MISLRLRRLQTGCSRFKVEHLLGFYFNGVFFLPFVEFGRVEPASMI